MGDKEQGDGVDEGIVTQGMEPLPCGEVMCGTGSAAAGAV